MYRIGEFSKLAKTTVKTLRYYEKESLLKPCYIDEYTGYRFYNSSQLVDLARILSLRQMGISISEIKNILKDNDYFNALSKRKEELEKELYNYQNQLSKINYLLEENFMDYEVIVKELPDYTVYYKEGVLKDFSEMTNFILSSADECRSANPGIKCISPDYCYVNYLDKKYKEKDILIRYAQAVEKSGIETDTIKFEKLKPVNAVCIYHKGSYASLPNAYSFIMKYIEDNGYQILECPRERYIDGIWNKESEEDWLTEIQVPIAK